MSARVSLCMIVRNEAANLAACLAPVADLVDETVVIDTGSDDDTPAIARRLGARVEEIAWPGSFAVARNASIRHARGHWVFWLDADDRIDQANRKQLQQLFQSLGDENVAYRMRSVSLKAAGSRDYVVSDHVRLFRRYPEIRWQYRVHEQILPAVVQAGGRVLWSDVTIEHLGYCDSEQRQQKHERNRRLLELDLQEHPDDPFVLFNLGWTLHVLGHTQPAIEQLRRSLQRCSADVRFKPPQERVYSVLASALQQLGQKDEAEFYLQKRRTAGPHDSAAAIHRGEALLAHQRFADLDAWIQQLSTDPGHRRDAAFLQAKLHLVRSEFSDAMALVQSLLRQFPRSVHVHELRARILWREGTDLAAAAAAFRQVLDLDPRHVQARHALRALNDRRNTFTSG